MNALTVLTALMLALAVGCGDDPVTAPTDAGAGDGGAVADAGMCVDVDTMLTPTTPSWTYAEEAIWATLSPTFMMCSGMDQSPINIVPANAANEPRALTFNGYGTLPLTLLNNGHTLEAVMATQFAVGNPSVTFNGTTYYLLQWHLHTLSEHQVDGNNFQMEAHFVHATSSAPTAAFLVVAVLLDTGPDNPVVATMLGAAPAEEHEIEYCGREINPNDLLPTTRGFFHYTPGSLTTPPCTEGLQWFVMDTPLTVGTAQVVALSGLVHGTNNRPVQLLNGRTVSHHMM